MVKNLYQKQTGFTLIELVVVIALLQLKMWFGEGGYRDVQRLAERVEEELRVHLCGDAGLPPSDPPLG